MRAMETAVRNELALEEALADGVVKAVEGDHLIVGLGDHEEGVLPLQELLRAGVATPAPGQPLKVFVERRDVTTSRWVLSKEKADRLELWDRLIKAFDTQETIEGVIVAPIEGGFSVDVGVKAFLPSSQVDLMPVRDLDRWLDQKLPFRILRFHKSRGNIVLSRRVLLEEERARTMEKLVPGAVVEGVVKNLADYGAFIDLGGVQGLLHVSDMSWGRISHPSDIVDPGDRVKVKVLEVDRERMRISLGLRQLQEDPWLDAERRYAVGARVRGTVVAITDYGVFVELEQGVEGLVHTTGALISAGEAKELSRRATIGEPLDAIVLETDVAKKRISLGWKRAEDAAPSS